MYRCIFHVDLDAFFVSVERVRDPSLRGKPVVVGGEAHTRGVVASASYEARAYGLRSGMSLSQAHRLCPHAIFLPGDYSRYREASQAFMGILASMTPEVEPWGIDEAYMDMTGFEPFYGPPMEAARQIKERVKNELGIVASIGIASSRLVAKVASSQSKPDGLIEVPPNEDARFLAPLPIAKLPCVGRTTEVMLKSRGILTIGDLAATPATTLSTLLGVHGVVLHRHANGIDSSPVKPAGPAKSISRETTFMEDTLELPFLQAVLRYLSERVGRELRQQGKEARCVTVKLRYADFQTVTRSITLKEGSHLDQVIFSVGQSLLTKALRQRREKVRLIGIGVSDLSLQRAPIPSLDSRHHKLFSLAQAVDAVRQRYGFTVLQTGRTFPLRHVFPSHHGDYVLKTPALSR